MTKYMDRINPATQNSKTHRRHHSLELSAFRQLDLDQIGAYALISNQMFADGNLGVPVDQPRRLEDLLPRSAVNARAIIDKLIEVGLIQTFDGYFITVAQVRNFKKTKTSNSGA